MSENASSGSRRPRLADAVVAALRSEIVKGVLPVDSRLPTEPFLVARFGVSRTVIREALAELRAAGLVRTVQGAGAFVAKVGRPPEAVALTQDEMRSIPHVLEMLEYRTGMECQAAMLAAMRATRAEAYAIRNAHERVERLVEAGEPSVEADRELHLAIAEASHNTLFPRALRTLGAAVIPRSLVPNHLAAQEGTYLRLVIEEHRAIVEAIFDCSPDGAVEAMRAHLGNSLRRYEAMVTSARALPAGQADASPGVTRDHQKVASPQGL